MTIVIVDAAAGMMVSDTLVTDGNLNVFTTKKIVRCKNGALAAAAGNSTECCEFLAWAKAGCKGAFPEVEELLAVMLTPAREVRIFDKSKHFDVVEGGFVAIGAGREIAMGAHHAGATLVGCVEAAIALSPLCGGKIQIETLKQ